MPGVGESITTGAVVGGVFGAAKELMFLESANTARTASFGAVGRGIIGPGIHCAIAGGLFGLGNSAMAGLRNKDDSLNGAAGGALTGIYFGLKGKGGLHMAFYKAVGFGAAGIFCNYLGSYMDRKGRENKTAEALYR
jgi:hypothetical protein